MTFHSKHSLPDGYRFRKFKRGALARLARLARLALFSPRFDRVLKANTPLKKLEYRNATRTDNLIIFLPGIGDLAEDFERNGFIHDMRRHGIAADAVAVDAHYGYYASRAIHDRITEDVIASALHAGYRKIWLAGISLGGFGAASYAARHSLDLAGLLLFAPYLGGTELVREIAAAGGARNWEPGIVREGDYQRALWAWLRNHFSGVDAKLPIYLGYGKSDMFRHANALLADLLPGRHVHSIPGGHDWRTWRQLWQSVLTCEKTGLRTLFR